ncbi:MAG: DNA polymerase III subunit gamma/tau [Acidimicrobiia bacterium]
MSYQSLYRRYRSGRFGELRGQEHVVRALRNAVRENRVGHAYLFSGPRGTGKTSTARILAKALNCENVIDGEPCGECASCLAIEAGNSFDLHELDAASNNGVEAVRDLISRTVIASPGRTKVYVLDEVHMLTTAASNALLKTLEEPPSNVVFILATTDPHKVLPTIRSRTQHLEFGLISAEELEEHVRYIINDAELGVDEEGIAYALRQGGGSARDTLSVLEQIVAAGGVPASGDAANQIVDALAEEDTAAALVALNEALNLGREPRPLAEDLLSQLRNVFLASVRAPLVNLTEADVAKANDQAQRLGRATITRALELIGAAIAEMRFVGDPRIPLEVAVVRLTQPAIDTSLAALVERVAKLERQVASAGEAGAAPTAPPPSVPPRPSPSVSAQPPPEVPSASAQSSVPSQASAAPEVPSAPAKVSADVEQAKAETKPEPPKAATTTTSGATATASNSGALPKLEALESAWRSTILPGLGNRTRARYGAGEFIAVDSEAHYALPNMIHRDRCEELRGEVEAALQAHFGVPVPLKLVVQGASSEVVVPRQAATEPERNYEEELADLGDVSELPEADVAASTIERITEMFPGTTVVDTGGQT